MTMFDFLHQHPWWGFVYLLVIVMGAIAIAAAFMPKKDESKKPPFDVEDRS